ncbi:MULTISPECIES: 30S ribosomal protein S21 [Flagellimonas]|uniref:Small ribosomal subunit protein bS21 n=1 Tax=Flagellimonas algicola TaxID=2583815 RepID=A0ABY2WI28_9FLAO|nr:MULTISPECIES: 30S ribosomal protein S21 [Allomuricauda]TMU54504.1 30S ribosomal protein S21 [Allomuricauda algicola]
MLKIKIVPGENIERALKRYKRKYRNTQVLKQIKSNQEFTKKSKLRRDKVAKAVYREKYLRLDNE